jgi:hypothetical protein
VVGNNIEFNNCQTYSLSCPTWESCIREFLTESSIFLSVNLVAQELKVGDHFSQGSFAIAFRGADEPERKS